MKSRLDYIIAESINLLLLEEFGVIKGLEPFADFILDRLFLYNNERRYRREGVKVSMDFIVNHVNCKNWYGLDKINMIVLNTTSYSDIAEIDIIKYGVFTPEIIIDIERFRKKMRYCDNKNQAKEIFNSIYKSAIMHELTHLVEAVNANGKGYKFPAYSYMANFPKMCDASCAFSKTELNARITTIYYEVLNNPDIIEKIENWKGDFNSLCKSIIDDTKNYSWIRTLEKLIGIFDNASNGDYKCIEFVREFIDINRESAFSGSKNVFRLKWGVDKNDSNMITSWDDSDDNVMRMAKNLSAKMNSMYYTHLRKLYNVVSKAIYEVKKVKQLP